MKGVYQSLRMAEVRVFIHNSTLPTNITQGKRLVINVDISNSCFWHETRFDQLAFLISGTEDQIMFMSSATSKDGGEPPLNRALKRLNKNHFMVRHRGQTTNRKFQPSNLERCISSPQDSAEGVHCPEDLKVQCKNIQVRCEGQEHWRNGEHVMLRLLQKEVQRDYRQMAIAAH